MDKIRFIVLHNTWGGTIVINPRYIISIDNNDGAYPVEAKSVVNVKNRMQEYYVTETIDEIFELINATEDENK